METKHNEHANMLECIVNHALSLESGQRILQRPCDSCCQRELIKIAILRKASIFAIPRLDRLTVTTIKEYHSPEATGEDNAMRQQ
jgi:hypothetical protein